MKKLEDDLAKGSSKFKVSIALKITGLLFFSLTLFALITAVITQACMKRVLTEEFISKGKSIATGFAKSSIELLIDKESASIQSFLDDYVGISGVSYVFIVDKKGEVIAHTFVPVFPEKILEINPNSGEAGETVREIDIEGKIRAIDIAVPILYGTLGVVHVGMSKELIEKEVSSVLKKVWTVFIISLLGALTVGITMSLHVIRPIKKLTHYMLAMAEGGLDPSTVEIRTNDEIGVLAGSFKEMAVKLIKSHEEIKRKNIELEKSREELLEKNFECTRAYKDLQKAQEQLIRTEKLSSMGLLAASVAHDINNPLAGILTFVRVIRRKIEKGDLDPSSIEGYVKNLQLIEQEVERCGHVVRNLLDFAKSPEPKLELLDLNTVLERTLALVEHKLKISGISLTKNLQNLPYVRGDSRQLVQVFLNIIMNAIEAMKDGKKVIMVKSYPGENGSEAVVEISDTGIGVDEENLEKIFDPFFTTKQKGTGLGLSVVRSIVSEHEGRIDIRSQKGEGTTVIVSFPAAEKIV